MEQMKSKVIKGDVGMNWGKARLGDICEINMGKTPSRSNSTYWNGYLPWVSIADLKGETYITRTKECITETSVVESGIKVVPKNTLLYSFKLSIGKVAITGIDIYTNEAIVALPIKNKDIIDLKYLYWAIQNIKTDGIGDKAVMGLTLNKAKLKCLEIPLPPLPIQNRIAEILDAADSLRRKDQELLLKYDELAQSIFIDMFGDPVKNEKGWEVKTIGDVCYSVKDGPHVSPKYTKTGIPFISVNNIINGVIDISNCKYISQEDFEIYSKKGKPEKQDILYTKGGTTGFAKRVDVDFEFSQWVHVALLKFNHHIINSAFFEYMLNNSFCYNQSQLRTKGIANRDLVLGEIKKIQILLPPIQKQREFESKILLLEKARKGNLESIDRSSSLFNSLLQQAFKGNLVK